MDNSILEIYKMLRCYSSYGDQLKGIKLARELDDLSLIILPSVDGESKYLWDNCARALYEISDERLEPYLSSLLEWLQDLRWPGALIILDRLRGFPPEIIKAPLQFSVQEAIDNKDGAWLDYLSELLDVPGLSKHLSENYLAVLEKHYNDWGNGV